MAKVVIVDDAALIRIRLKTILKDLGHEVVGEAANGVEAVKLYGSQKPDLITLDISMPEQDGITTIDQIFSGHPDAKIIVVSALGQKQIITDALAKGVKAFVTKPFEPEQVAQKVSKVLGV